MTTVERLARWRTTGAITPAQYAVIAPIVSGDRFSLFLELNALLYLGVLAFVAGLGWTVHDHFAALSDAGVLVGVFGVFLGCLAYCFVNAGPYQPGAVESPTFSFDYVLYLGCLSCAVGLGYLEFRFQLLKTHWDIYLLASAILYAMLAYRFDNRFVLSLALSTLAGWFGVRFSMHGLFLSGSIRGDALVYSGVVSAVGALLYRAGAKPHFFETYLHVAVNAALAALVSGVANGHPQDVWLVALLLLSGSVIERGVQLGRFVFAAYGICYAYVGVCIRIVPHIDDEVLTFLFLIVSGGAVLVSLVVLARRGGREP